MQATLNRLSRFYFCFYVSVTMMEKEIAMNLWGGKYGRDRRGEEWGKLYNYILIN